MPEPASRMRMAPVRWSRISMHGVLQPWMMPSGTDQGTDPRTPRNRTRIASGPGDALVRRLDATRELAQQFLGAFRVLGQHVSEIVPRDAAQLRIRGGDHRRRSRLVEEQAHLADPVARTEPGQGDLFAAAHVERAALDEVRFIARLPFLHARLARGAQPVIAGVERTRIFLGVIEL